MLTLRCSKLLQLLPVQETFREAAHDDVRAHDRTLEAVSQPSLLADALKHPSSARFAQFLQMAREVRDVIVARRDGPQWRANGGSGEVPQVVDIRERAGQ